MNYLQFYTGGHPLQIDDFIHFQNGLNTALQAIANTFSSNGTIILSGCTGFSDGTSDGMGHNIIPITSGFIFMGGKLYTHDDHTGGSSYTLSDSATMYWAELITTDGTISPVTYLDTTTHNVHEIRKIILTDNASLTPHTAEASTARLSPIDLITRLVGLDTKDTTLTNAIGTIASLIPGNINSRTSKTNLVSAIISGQGAHYLVYTKNLPNNTFDMSAITVSGGVYSIKIPTSVDTASGDSQSPVTWYDFVTNYRYSSVMKGYYRVSASLKYLSSADHSGSPISANIKIRMNGTDLIALDEVSVYPGNSQIVKLSGEGIFAESTVNSGNYYELWFSSSSNDIEVIISSIRLTYEFIGIFAI
jgi:hypothetical protein